MSEQRNPSPAIEETLRRPGAPELYKRLRKTAWLSPFLECKSPMLRRLGATLLIDEMLSTLDPKRQVEADLENERDERRTKRLEGKKRAAEMWLAGSSYADIARALGVSPSVAMRWSYQGRAAIGSELEWVK